MSRLVLCMTLILAGVSSQGAPIATVPGPLPKPATSLYLDGRVLYQAP